MRKHFKKSVICAAVLAGIASGAYADELSDLRAQNQALSQRLDRLEQQQKAAGPAASPLPTGNATSDALTWKGVTLYGNVDIGLAFQTHGQALNQAYGLNYFVSRASQGSYFGLAPNALSSSNIGLRGDIPVANGWNAIFRFESSFVPTSGQLTDPLKAVVQNNGVPLSQQNSNGDSSRAGQLFANAAFFGLSHKTWGTFTLGRQNSMGLDGVGAYDPQGGSAAFSMIGFQGATAGAGGTEAARLDNTLKYRVGVGPVRLGALYQFGAGNPNATRGANEWNVGVDVGGFSADVIYSRVYDLITTAAVTPAAGVTTTVVPADLNQTNLISGTVADSSAWYLLAKYDFGKVRLYGGFVRLEDQNPGHPLAIGAPAVGGYLLGRVNNTAFNTHRIRGVYWAGAKWQVSPDFVLTGAYYHQTQNDFTGGNTNVASTVAANVCSTNKNLNGNCKGTQDAFSLVAEYRFNDHWSTYAGAMYSHVDGGISSGFIHSSSVDPTIGARLRF